MPSSNQQRREAARRKLERQLLARQEKARRRRRGNLIASIVGALVVVGVVIGIIAATSGGHKNSNSAAGSSDSASSIAATPSVAATTTYPAATGAAVSFNGVTVTGAADLKGRPGVTSKSAAVPTKVEIKDLVVGTGTAATSASTVNVQYIGALYKTGAIFDESWKRGAPSSFPLSGVVPGFSQGIGGTTGVAPMKVGGRRIIIIPASLGYKAEAQTGIPANSTLVFVVDLISVTPTAAAAS